jgi:hypothetical protein
VKHPVLVALFLGALCAAGHRVPAHLDGELGDLAERLVREIGPPLLA